MTELFEIAREKIWTMTRLHAQARLKRGTKNFTCSRGLEGGTRIKRNYCVDQQNRIKYNFHLRLGVRAPLGRVPAGSPTQSPMELRH